MIPSRSFLLIFKSPSISLNIFVIIFIFCLPRIISLSEISLSLEKESIIDDNLPPLFCFFMLFIIASATLSDALLLNFATAGVDPLFFLIDFARLSIAFLIPFVSSSMSLICLRFIFVEFPPPISIDFFFVAVISTNCCKIFFISFTIA